MRQSIQLQIAEPCHENWNQMTAQAQGRFCGSCQKTVTDFTNMSDGQLLEYFKNYNSNTCGRFENHQLDRVLITPPPTTKPSRYKWALAMLFSGFLFSSKAKAQIGKMRRVETCQQEPATQNKGEVPVSSVQKTTELRGRIVDETGVGIPYASVQLKSQRWGVSADSLGHFTIHVKTPEDMAVLSCSSVGYIEKEWVVNLQEASKENLLVSLLPKTDLDNVIVNGYGSIRRTSTTGGAVLLVVGQVLQNDSVGKSITNIIRKPSIGLIYPNPAKAGSHVTIPFKQNDNYSVRMLDVGGKMLLAKGSIQIQSPQNYMLQIPMQAAAGQYFIQILNAKGETVATEKIIIIY